jgi:hypothetical protein
VASIARRTEGIERVALLFCPDADLSVIHEELERFALQSDAELATQPFDIFSLAELDWTETGSLYARLLVRGTEQLRSSLLGDSCPCHIEGLGPLEPDVLIPVADMAAALPAQDVWLKDQLGSIVARYGDKEVRAYLLGQLANGEPGIRYWVKVHVLRYIADISTDDMPEDAIAFLLADLSRTGALSFWNNPLGRVASERFVTERLIPLVRGASDTVLNNLRIVLKAAGDRNGRRYFLPN